MPMQDYTVNTRDFVVGQLYGISMTNSVRQSYSNLDENGAGSDIGFALAVQRVAGHDRRAIAGVGEGADGDTVHIFGLTMRQINTEQDTYPGTGEVSYHAGDVMGVLHDGMLTVEVAGSAAAVADAPCFVNRTTGEIAAEAGAGYVQAANMSFQSSGEAGSIVVATITQAVMTPVAIA